MILESATHCIGRDIRFPITFMINKVPFVDFEIYIYDAQKHIQLYNIGSTCT